jgi:hypothetical protein
MTTTNKRLLISESRGDSNQCTPCRGKPDQHNMYAFHASPRTPNVRFLRAIPVRGNPLRVDGCTAPDSTSQPGWVVYGTHHSFSPNTSIEAVCLSQAPVNGRLLGLPDPYHWHVIGTFNTCSWVPTPRSLTDTGGGYHIDNLGIATALSLPPPLPRVPLIPLMAPPGLRLFTTITDWTGEGTIPKSREWEPPLNFYHNLPSKYSNTNGKPPQDGGNKDKSEGRS